MNIDQLMKLEPTIVRYDLVDIKQLIKNKITDIELLDIIDNVLNIGINRDNTRSDIYWNSKVEEFLFTSMKLNQVDRKRLTFEFCIENDLKVRRYILSIIKSIEQVLLDDIQGSVNSQELIETCRFKVKAYLDILSPFISTRYQPLDQAGIKVTISDFPMIYLSEFDLFSAPVVNYCWGTEIGNYLLYKHLNTL